MTAEQVNKHFSKNYSNYVKVARGMIRRMKFSHIAEEVVNDSFIYVSEKIEKLRDLEDIDKTVSSFLSLEICRRNSKTNRSKSGKAIDYDVLKVENERALKYFDEEKENIQESISDYKEHRTGIKVKVLDLFLQNKGTCKEVGEGLGVSKVTAFRRIKEMREDFKKFI